MVGVVFAVRAFWVLGLGLLIFEARGVEGYRVYGRET